MKKLLLLAAGALVAMSANAQWAVVGAYCDWSFQTATIFEGEGDNLTCTIDELTPGFKIVDITDNNWDTQYGTSTPIELGKDYVLDPKEGDTDPSDMTFAGDTFAVENAVVSWNPTTATLSITGTPIEQEVDESVIYLIGDPNGWGINNGDFPLYATEPGVYEATFNIAAGDAIYFRFYTALGDWASDGNLPSIGPLPNDNTNEVVEFTDNVFTGTCEPGKGSWTLENWEGGEISMSVNLNNWTVWFGINGAGVENLGVDANAPAVYYNLNGVRVNNPEKGVYVVKQGNKTSKVVIR